MQFDPAAFADQPSPIRRATLRRWLKRLCLLIFFAVGLGAALLLFAPLL